MRRERVGTPLKIIVAWEHIEKKKRRKERVKIKTKKKKEDTKKSNNKKKKKKKKKKKRKRKKLKGRAGMSPRNSFGGTQRASITMTRYTGRGQSGLWRDTLQLAEA